MALVFQQVSKETPRCLCGLKGVGTLSHWQAEPGNTQVDVGDLLLELCICE